MNKLEAKIALVTGGTSGIGLVYIAKLVDIETNSCRQANFRCLGMGQGWVPQPPQLRCYRLG